MPLPPPLHLNEDVHFCVTEGVGVFLDLRRDEYSAITIPPELADSSCEMSEANILRAFEVHREELLRENLLVEGSGAGSEATAYRRLLRPSSNIFAPGEQRAFGLSVDACAELRSGVRDLLDFFLASRKASVDLQKKHLHEVVSAVRRRKANAGPDALDISALRRQVAIYAKLRPWYPQRYLCLYDALALVEFLARRNLFPTWVFAVQAQPFGAHCWVQAGDHLLNEVTEYAREFTPIMAI
jgi:hypothetical protein